MHDERIADRALITGRQTNKKNTNAFQLFAIERHPFSQLFIFRSFRELTEQICCGGAISANICCGGLFRQKFAAEVLFLQMSLYPPVCHPIIGFG